MENNNTNNIEKIINYLFFTVISIVFVIYLTFYFIEFFYSPYSNLIKDNFGIDILKNFHLSEIYNQLSETFNQLIYGFKHFQFIIIFNQLIIIFSQLLAIFSELFEDFKNYAITYVFGGLLILIINIGYALFYGKVVVSGFNIKYDNKEDNLCIITLVFFTLWFVIPVSYKESFFPYENFFLNFLIYCLAVLFQSLAVIYTKKTFYLILIIYKLLVNYKKLNLYAEKEYQKKLGIFDLLITLLLTPILFFLVLYFMFIQDLKPLYESIKELLK